MNVTKALSLLSTIPAFLIHAGALEHEAAAALKNPQLIAELEANPAIKVKVDMLSSEWRTVENDATSVKKSNILTFFPRAGRFLSDSGRLVKDVQAKQHDAGLVAALASMPHLSAELAVLSAQWSAVQKDLGGLA